MAKRTLKRILAGGALLAILSLITPPPAQAAGLNVESLRSWLFNLWAGPAPTTVSGHAQAHKPSARTGPLEKIGPAIDPNGPASNQTTGTSGSTCVTGCDIGPGMDPNG
jgi:hypothetical protein